MPHWLYLFVFVAVVFHSTFFLAIIAHSFWMNLEAFYQVPAGMLTRIALNL